MPYSYNPLIVAKLDKNKKYINDLEDVNTSGTVNGKVLTYQSGTWIPGVVAGVGDMLKAEYITGSGTVYNASRLEGDNDRHIWISANPVNNECISSRRHNLGQNISIVGHGGDVSVKCRYSGNDGDKGEWSRE
jgi:hypothetical protein